MERDRQTMGKLWVRLDTNIAHHDKMLTLVAQREGHRAALVYVFGLAWCGLADSDGRIPDVVLPAIHGTKRHADMLCDAGLWEKNGGGYVIPNWAERQELTEVSDAKHKASVAGGYKGACVRDHGPDCGCWRDKLPEWAR